MSTISQAQRARLGIFVVAGAITLFFLIAIPLGIRLSAKEKTFYAYFAGESMSGLEEGAPVKYHGVPIGKIAKIAYDKSNLTRIKVIIKVQSGFPMKKDMYAQTWAMGITGLNYLDILGGTNEAPLLPENSEIPTKVSILSTITGKVDIIMDKVELLLNQLNDVTSPQSPSSIKKVLENLTAITGDARTFFANFTDVGPDFRDMSRSSRVIIHRIDSIASDIHVTTTAIAKGLGNNQLGQIITRVDSTASTIKSLSETMLLMVRQSREDVSVSMQNLREALENANQLIKVLSDNPSLILKGEPTRERER
jgi:phospholipid/cholesterol/gamma-HCH transport system substrate-binding protein